MGKPTLRTVAREEARRFDAILYEERPNLPPVAWHRISVQWRVLDEATEEAFAALGRGIAVADYGERPSAA